VLLNVFFTSLLSSNWVGFLCASSVSSFNSPAWKEFDLHFQAQERWYVEVVFIGVRPGLLQVRLSLRWRFLHSHAQNIRAGVTGSQAL
jgi:hypothetical protein